ncbi:Hamartin protein-domain-containing protein [Pilobolus umbonatus]|nr:Hamartin protein-domain-containing protein [Pilobolus umbonatus]
MVSLKDIIKSISHSVRHATVETEGQPTLDIIETYIDEQTSANIGDSHSSLNMVDASSVDKLSQELMALYESVIQPTSAYISCHPDMLRIHTQHYILLRYLHALLPILRPKRLLEDWWPLLEPLLKTSPYTYKIKKEARLIVSDCLITEQELIRQGEMTEPVYFHKIIRMYLEWMSGTEQRKKEDMIKQHQVLMDLEQDEWSKNLTCILLSLGASETKPFFILLDTYFLSSKHRLQIVYLLSEFMRRRRTHLHEILDTPLFLSLLKSLMYDNSTTLIAISVTNIIMLLPRICTSLPKYLPHLFYIFARAICWDQLRDLRKKQGFEIYQPSVNRIDNDWDCVDYTFSKLSAPPSNPQTGPFFTSLYGLYPCNFLKFLHKPYSYFKENEFTLPEEFDEETFRGRTIPQVNRHMLHPNLVTMDAESELSDKTRWMKMEPPDVLAQIMGLDLTNAASRVAFASATTQPSNLIDDSFLVETVEKRHDTKPYEEAEEEEEEEKDDSHDKYEKEDEEEEAQEDTENNEEKNEEWKGELDPVVISNIVNFHRALKSGSEVLAGEDIWAAEMEPLPSGTNTPFSEPIPLTSVPETTMDEMPLEAKLLVASLKREVLLLRNELNFELFLKQQHLQHIGRLHREHVLDSSVEAERQELYNTTRMLKTQLSQATVALEQLKAESAQTKKRHVKWEDEQSVKLSGYRTARKEWQTQLSRTEHRVMDYEKLLKEQKIELDQARQKIFELENELNTLQPTLSRVTEYEHRVQQLTQQMLLWEKDTKQMEEQKRYIKELLSQWWGTEELVASLQEENKRLKTENGRLQDVSHQKELSEHHKLETNHTEESEELRRLRQTLNEVREKLESLEIENMEYQAEIEALKSQQK